MLDLSWPELFFVAVLALVIIGPKDLPELFQLFTKLVSKLRRMYADLQGGMAQLQKEVNIVSGKAQPGDDSWRDFLPPEVRRLPKDFIPGSLTAEEHKARRQHIERARQQASSQNTAASDTPIEEKDNG